MSSSISWVRHLSMHRGGCCSGEHRFGKSARLENSAQVSRGPPGVHKRPRVSQEHGRMCSGQGEWCA